MLDAHVVIAYVFGGLIEFSVRVSNSFPNEKHSRNDMLVWWRWLLILYYRKIPVRKLKTVKHCGVYQLAISMMFKRLENLFIILRSFILI